MVDGVISRAVAVIGRDVVRTHIVAAEEALEAPEQLARLLDERTRASRDRVGIGRLVGAPFVPLLHDVRPCPPGEQRNHARPDRDPSARNTPDKRRTVHAMRRRDLGVLVPLVVWLTIKVAVLPLVTHGSERITYSPSTGWYVAFVVLAVGIRRGSTLAWLLAVLYDASFVLMMLVAPLPGDGPRVFATAVVAAVSLATLGWPSLRSSIRTG